MTDEQVKDLLRSALPPANRQNPSRDLWPQVVSRIGAARQPGRGSTPAWRLV